MVTAEYAPLAKTGGLADAVAGLAAALHARGHDVRVLLPKYPGLPPAGFTPVRAGRGAAHAGSAAASAPGTAAPFVEVAGDRPGPRVYLLEAPEFEASAGLYAGDDRDAASFARLSRAALELPDALGWRPEILHCHDWHAALVPALASGAAGRDRACVLTLHNVGYQGVFGERILADNGLGELAELRDERERAEHSVNFLKLGIRCADSITTVSPTYAREIQTPEYGMGLEAALRARGDAVTGILNGVDYSTWSPDSDAFLEAHYSRAEPAGKRRVKTALCAELGLPADARPLVGAVTRLVWQKGIDLLAAALPDLLERSNARFALLGSGEAGLEQALRDLAARHPERIAFRRGYDEALAHRILAGGDFVLVPSRYEPCGLTQLYALRYGTIPIVRATGGLADTVKHFDPAAGTGNGSVFEDADLGGILWGVSTALAWYGEPGAWARLMDNAMAADFSWAHQAPEYEALYARLARSLRSA